MAKVPPSWDRAWQFAKRQVERLLQSKPGYYPMYTVKGRWGHEPDAWTHWCEGFLPGLCWLFALDDLDLRWQSYAIETTRPLEPRKYDDQVHDLGFIFINSFARWYQLEGQPELMDCVATAGITLASRFRDAGRYIPSFVGPQSLFVDIMMNVPIVFAAARWIEERGCLPEGSERTFIAFLLPEEAGPLLRERAEAHCETSRRYLVRPDGSTAHEALFDPQTGAFLRTSTHQGLSADSCWSRGQAWALYGFARCYRLTGRDEWLETACRCADYFLEQLPPEGVPPWDFQDARPEAPRDSSAAAIAASGLWTLSRLTTGSQAAKYREASARILDALCSDRYLAASDPAWEGILKHAVYHLHRGLGVDESVIWGDYYFVEALWKWRRDQDLIP